MRIDKKDLRELQRNLILSHAAGVGTPLPLPEARALLLLRCNVLAKGYSGIRPETLQLALEMLNRDVVPVVPERGSVGASGDLAPLAHLALVFIGEGEAFYQGAADAGARRRWRRGAQAGGAGGQGGPGAGQRHAGDVRGGHAARSCARETLADMADLAGSMTLEGLLGSHKPFIPEIHDVRPHAGQKAVRRAPAAAAGGQRAGGDARQLQQGAGPVLAALHAAGARRGARRAGVRAAHPRGRR